MKKCLLILLLLISCESLFSQKVLPRPDPPRLVNDAAGVLTPEQVATLEHKLVALDDSTSNQIAVVLIKTLDDVAIEEYAVKLFNEWGIGNKKTKNGVLIIAAIDDRKMWIEVGSGLEGAIPDVLAATIYRNEMVPEFKKQNYYQGIDNAINALTKAAVGEYKVPTNRSIGTKGNTSGRSIFTFIIILVVIIFILGRNGRGGTGGGGIGGLAEGLIIGSLLGGGRGGGDWGGGSGGGGGGFGGFGGGDTGGGGAGGSW